MTWPCGRYFHSMCRIDEQTFALFGGQDNQSHYLNDFYFFSTENEKWTRVPYEGTIEPRAGGLLFKSQESNILYLFGGFRGDGGTETVVDMFLYKLDSRNPKWREFEVTGSLPFVRRYIPSSNGFVFGGFDGHHPTNDLLYFSESEKRWNVIPTWAILSDAEALSLIAKGSKGVSATPRYGHVMAVREKSIIIFAGAGSTYLNDLVQFCRE